VSRNANLPVPVDVVVVVPGSSGAVLMPSPLAAGGTGDEAGACGFVGSAGAVKATPGATAWGAAATDRPVVLVRRGAVVAGGFVVGAGAGAAAVVGAGAALVGAAVLGAVAAGASAAGAVDVSREICLPVAGWTTAMPAAPSTRHTPIRRASRPGVRRDVTRGCSTAPSSPLRRVLGD
jgi:hypothetical protein